MRILHINQSDISGGAAIAGYRLHKGLLQKGMDSRLLVGNAETKDAQIALIPTFEKPENLIFHLTSRLGLNFVHHLGSFKVLNHQFFINADILNFHNLHSSPLFYGSPFSYLAISALTKTKPAVFTLHDMWSFTGHCAYSYDCDRWKIGCGKCPYPEAYPAIQRDNTHLEWTLKNWVYEHSHLTIVTPSRWLAEQAQLSMLSRFPVHHIPNGVETNLYQPLDPEQCKAVLGIPVTKRVLMFGAEILGDLRKGADLLLKVLQGLPQSLKSEVLVLTFGKSGDEITKAAGMEVFNLGYIGGDRMKAIAYSAADLFLFPTRADNLPLVLQESMACGTPMVSFNVGGVPDLVRSGITGYLAKPEDIQDFQDGLLELLEDIDLRTQMGQNCREIALQEYSLDLQIRRYLDLYKQMLNQKSP
jgi:glycosyltransferase involved in cell wall biosynthesis